MLTIAGRQLDGAVIRSEKEMIPAARWNWRGATSKNYMAVMNIAKKGTIQLEASSKIAHTSLELSCSRYVLYFYHLCSNPRCILMLD
jgi:hypothetical protein